MCFTDLLGKSLVLSVVFGVEDDSVLFSVDVRVNVEVVTSTACYRHEVCAIDDKIEAVETLIP